MATKSLVAVEASPWSCVRVMARGGITPILETTPTDGSTATDESSFTARFKVKMIHSQRLTQG